MELFELYKFKFTLVNIIDILLVAVIAIQLYRLLKGSLAFNMLVGLFTIYLFWLVVRYFKMPLLEGLLGEFTKIGFLAILIIFHQEIRKFLLIVGKRSFLAEKKSIFKFLPWNWKIEKTFHTNFDDILEACEYLAQLRNGAILVFPKTSEMKFIGTTGESLDSHITKRLLISIFSRYSPLHDGAVIIANNQIKFANVVLPVSENPEYQNKYGLRHLSAIGITEQSDAVVLVISEERGTIAVAKEGKLIENMNHQQIAYFLNKEFANVMVKMNS
ncbi:MAG: diadenylate cyclase CdaA [Bacteroidia bacterium]